MDKQLQPQIRDKIEHVAPVRHEYKKVSSIRARPGMILWEFSAETLELKEVEISRKSTSVDMFGKPVVNSKAVYNPKAIYLWAINRKNAERKVENMMKNYRR